MFRYELVWHDGTTEIIEGHSIAHAFSMAGYSSGAIAALESYHCMGKVKK